MQQPPGYRPRGYGICVMDVDWRSRGNYSEIVDCVISRMQMEHLKKRVDEIFCEVDKQIIMNSFLQSQTCNISEFDNDLVRRLIASIKVVSGEKLIIQFQSGIVMEQEISYD